MTSPDRNRKDSTLVSRRPALIFDFGNVVAHFDYMKACDRLAARLGMTGKDLLARAVSAGFSDLVKAYEAGKMSAEDFSGKVCGLVGLEITHAEFADAWSDIFWLNESVAELILELKSKGYTLVLGSNTNDLHANHFRPLFAEALAQFDRLILSYEVGHIKPSADFYLACADAAGATPSECVFIDDLAENVEGAKAAGLQAILYLTTDRLRADLAAHGVEVGA